MALSQKVFEEYSEDGRMTCAQLKKMLSKQGYTEIVSDEEIDAAFVRLDADGTGFLEYREFQEWWKAEYEHRRPDPEPGEWEEVQANARVSCSYQRAMELKFESPEESTSTAAAKREFLKATSMLPVMDKESFHKHCYLNGYCLTTDELDTAFEDLDKDGSGAVEFAEYLRWWRDDARFTHLPQDDSEETKEWIKEISAYFQTYDEDFNGYLDTSQFTNMWNDGLSDTCSGYSLEDVLAQADVNRDGRISFNEFIAWYAGEQSG